MQHLQPSSNPFRSSHNHTQTMPYPSSISLMDPPTQPALRPEPLQSHPHFLHTRHLLQPRDSHPIKPTSTHNIMENDFQSEPPLHSDHQLSPTDVRTRPPHIPRSTAVSLSQPLLHRAPDSNPAPQPSQSLPTSRQLPRNTSQPLSRIISRTDSCPIPQPESNRFLPFSKSVTHPSSFPAPTEQRNDACKQKNTFQHIPPLSQCGGKRKPLPILSKHDERHQVHPLRTHSMERVAPRLLPQQIPQQPITLPSLPGTMHESIPLPRSAPAQSKQSHRMPQSQHNQCGQEELAAASALNKMASAGGLHSSPPQSSVSERIDKLEEDLRLFSKDIRQDLAKLRDMMAQQIDMTRQILGTNKKGAEGKDEKSARRRHTTTDSTAREGCEGNPDVNDVQPGNTNDVERLQRSTERGATRSGLSSRHSSSVPPPGCMKHEGPEFGKESIAGRAKVELVDCLDARVRGMVPQKRAAGGELTGGEMSSVGGSTSCSDRPRQRQKIDVGEEVIVQAGVRKKRVRDNWTPQEDEVFFALVMEMRGMAEQSVLRKLADRLGPRRTYHQCKGHLKNMRAAGKLPG